MFELVLASLQYTLAVKKRDHSIRVLCSYFHRADSNERIAHPHTQAKEQWILNNPVEYSFTKHFIGNSNLQTV